MSGDPDGFQGVRLRGGSREPPLDPPLYLIDLDSTSMQPLQGSDKPIAREFAMYSHTQRMVRERSGSVVESLTRDRRAAISSLTGVTALWSLIKTHLS